MVESVWITCLTFTALSLNKYIVSFSFTGRSSETNLKIKSSLGLMQTGPHKHMGTGTTIHGFSFHMMTLPSLRGDWKTQLQFSITEQDAVVIVIRILFFFLCSSMQMCSRYPSTLEYQSKNIFRDNIGHCSTWDLRNWCQGCIRRYTTLVKFLRSLPGFMKLGKAWKKCLISVQTIFMFLYYKIAISQSGVKLNWGLKVKALVQFITTEIFLGFASNPFRTGNLRGCFRCLSWFGFGRIVLKHPLNVNQICA